MVRSKNLKKKIERMHRGQVSTERVQHHHLLEKCTLKPQLEITICL